MIVVKRTVGKLSAIMAKHETSVYSDDDVVRYLYSFAYSGVQHILCCVFVLFVFVLCLIVYPMLPVSLDCPFLIVPSVFSNVYILY